MAGLSDIPHISQLSGEFQVNAAAIDMMADAADVIIPSMTIRRRPQEEGAGPGLSFTVDTSYIPENMVGQIRVLMQQRQESIRQELHALGIDVTQTTPTTRQGPPPKPTTRRK